MFKKSYLILLTTAFLHFITFIHAAEGEPNLTVLLNKRHMKTYQKYQLKLTDDKFYDFHGKLHNCKHNHK